MDAKVFTKTNTSVEELIEKSLSLLEEKTRKFHSKKKKAIYEKK